MLHGLVHLLYFGHSWRLFELQPGLTWPDGVWVLMNIFGKETTRLLASIAYAVAAVSFVASGAGMLLNQTWWRPIGLGSAVFSTLLHLAFRDGTMQKPDAQGAIAILINVVIVAGVFFLT